MKPEFRAFPSIPRLSRDMIITEKLDGTNGAIYITPEGEIYAGSRNRWITPDDDNYGFAKWVQDNKRELLKLGEGWHHGEWWGQGIQCGYGLKEKRFSLFNTKLWNAETKPDCCHVVPILYEGEFCTGVAKDILESLRFNGSVAAPSFMNPEGIMIYHKQAGVYFKKTIKHDEKGKSYA